MYGAIISCCCRGWLHHTKTTMQHGVILRHKVTKLNRSDTNSSVNVYYLMTQCIQLHVSMPTDSTHTCTTGVSNRYLMTCSMTMLLICTQRHNNVHTIEAQVTWIELRCSRLNCSGSAFSHACNHPDPDGPHQSLQWPLQRQGRHQACLKAQKNSTGSLLLQILIAKQEALKGGAPNWACAAQSLRINMLLRCSRSASPHAHNKMQCS